MREDVCETCKRNDRPRLVVNADDFGIDPSVNAAIIECHGVGTLASTTLMVNQRATGEAVALAQRHPTLGVGLHFNLTLGAPLARPSDVPSLVDGAGRFRNRRDFERRAALRRVAPAEVVLELQAQYRFFCERLGRRPTHVDSHQHVHILPPCFMAVARFAFDEELALRMPWPAAPRPGVGLVRTVRSSLLRLLVANARRSLPPGVPCNAGFRSIFDLERSPERATAETYRTALLDGLPDGAEIMVHVATKASAAADLVDIGGVYANEFARLTDEGFAEALRTRYRLVRFDEAARPFI